MSIINQPDDDGTTTPPTTPGEAVSEAAREAVDAVLERCDFGSIAHARMKAVFEHVIQRAIDAEVAKATASLRRKLDAFLRDWAETDTAVREAALRVLTDFEVNGDTHGVPCVTDIVDVLVKRAEACAPLVEALLIETQNHLPECACAACKALAAHARAHGGAP